MLRITVARDRWWGLPSSVKSTSSIFASRYCCNCYAYSISLVNAIHACVRGRVVAAGYDPDCKVEPHARSSKLTWPRALVGRLGPSLRSVERQARFADVDLEDLRGVGVGAGFEVA